MKNKIALAVPFIVLAWWLAVKAWNATCDWAKADIVKAAEAECKKQGGGQ